MPHRCTVAQLGARRHYAIPRILYEEHWLERLHTDLCVTKGWPKWLLAALPEGIRPPSLRRLAARNPRGIPPDRIQTYEILGLKNSLRRRRAASAEDRARIDLVCRVEFAKAVARGGLGECQTVYTFDGAGLEILELARRRGIRGILDQCIVARAVVIEIVDRECEEFPEVGHSSIRDPGGQIAARERAEWEVADTIICGSEFVKDSIRQVGGPAEKVVVIPSGVDFSYIVPLKHASPKRPLHVLFVGEVGLRKGAHYLVEAARQLESTGTTFRFVGSVQFRESYLPRIPSNARLLGSVPRSEIQSHYEWADVFCFPSLCEGSALVTYEAMAMGLPVITTPNAGSIVRDGVDGYLIPPRSSAAIVDALERFAKDGLPAPEPDRPASGEPEDRMQDQPPAFSMEAYRRRLLPILSAAAVAPPDHAAVVQG